MVKPIAKFFKKKVTLKNGQKVWIRPIRERDTPYLLDIYFNLSPDSRYNRFQHSAEDLSPKLIESRAEQTANDSVNNGFGLIAFTDLDDQPKTPLGGARYHSDMADPYSAELAITIRDDMQRQGLGKLLLKKLIKEARQRGILYFTGVALEENEGVWHLLASTGLPLERWNDGPDVCFRMML